MAIWNKTTEVVKNYKGFKNDANLNKITIGEYGIGYFGIGIYSRTNSKTNCSKLTLTPETAEELLKELNNFIGNKYEKK
ncbi:MAG: hypothetical protein LBV37_02010 [Mycoplasmataceae bacterium]|jgi:hypothetical protein|nr:hypothetical protein [Mycoplasmataceae bacterium]